MGPWKVREPSLQLEFLIHFTFIPYSMGCQTTRVWHLSQLITWTCFSKGINDMVLSLMGFLKISKYTLTVCYTKALWLLVNVHKSTKLQITVCGSDKMKYNQNARWNMKHKGTENLSVILSSHIFHSFSSSVYHPFCVIFPLPWMKLPPQPPLPTQHL